MAFFDRKDDVIFIRWARQVKIRDHFTCQICELRGVELNAHHKNAWDSFPDERYDMDNGVCLCAECHRRFHEIYGYGGNTRQQFEQFEAMSEMYKTSAAQQIRVESALQDFFRKISDGYEQSI